MADAGDDFDIELKFLLVGDSGVGKTCILLRFCDDAFHDTFITTIGIDSKTRMLDVGSRKARIRVWDTAGQERFRTLSTSYFRKAQGALMVYDVSERSSFDSISRWLYQLQEHGDSHSAIALVGNKADLPEASRKVSTAEGRELAEEMGLPFFEVSAKAGAGVEAAFLGLSELAIKKGEAAIAGADGGIDLAAPPQPKKGCACAVM
ncbi:hypothetical protein FNF27_07777 [Cafeteria roenbergensis]|uniref:Ras-related protein Rab-18 n=1 Tax=Cafeteria roenbergensis TaxID=33653 RepID=A0A5A8E454_CAFRO|nr:hypothetical protein FNF29_03383 [Cafeteria roenbergensis]KAA0162647.1 hypothetical protein FNF31_03175 [Cafeteria roenbergensis]KAA0164636.1 hypothetical protein FNF27_07777 [Cafeteria roenbergensis]KAA0170701.1 hypothetical protein FNF28_01245 [Cafeteria roenbergensis]|eukprot:KAA0153195.1 hypothetical protein FNF29_03383 [Cafeteria roenbergensis]